MVSGSHSEEEAKTERMKEGAGNDGGRGSGVGACARSVLPDGLALQTQSSLSVTCPGWGGQVAALPRLGRAGSCSRACFDRKRVHQQNARLNPRQVCLVTRTLLLTTLADNAVLLGPNCRLISKVCSVYETIQARTYSFLQEKGSGHLLKGKLRSGNWPT